MTSHGAVSHNTIEKGKGIRQWLKIISQMFLMCKLSVVFKPP